MVEGNMYVVWYVVAAPHTHPMMLIYKGSAKMTIGNSYMIIFPSFFVLFFIFFLKKEKPFVY
jgi:hypothetical protein